ncbi:MAG: fumarylacetoacetate hydrolase family protein [Rhodospirillaceae bacterium]|nr:fumarylacetoacetate hydrolase family protein [Rhodospirillaceae bacterium]MBT6202935.1 fumarylacetoacetate hydrolase family protein [Rhodospirillaceae bacterium]MBT6509270.1 fumarylacetoacetate hydrolase family protein [Rhodospirillaceae bacterium]MBT7611889.1 fumarylacetoacetate hydrolase family protein [Rhodospirillaceae bacterium]
MKLVRYGEPGRECPGLIDDNGILRDLKGHVQDIRGPAFQEQTLDRIRSIRPDTLPPIEEEVRYGMPVGGIRKIVCIGLNYTDHAKETGNTPPEEPIAFFKPNTCLTGPNDPIVLLRNSHHTDWEVELAAVIGKRTKYVDEADALDHIAGYCVANDVSERKFQAKGTGQWILGKSGDTYCPLGPWFVTADEVPDPQNLRLWLDVNGERMQDGSTSNMIFGVAHLIHFVSQFMTLEPGDIVLTGTPAGVGVGRDPKVFLKEGDVVSLGIDGLGAQRSVIAPPE